MPIGFLKDMQESLPRGQSLLGLDVGAKTIGLALCDPAHRVVTPLRTIQRTKFMKDAEIIGQVVRDYEVGGFVIGLPLNMDGSEGPRAQSVRDFALELARQTQWFGQNPWIALFDERLSTAAVEDIVDKSVNHSRRQAKKKGITDQLAAQVILQNALNALTA